MNSKSFFTASKNSSTDSKSFITISSNNSVTSNESCCENNHCVYCHNNTSLYVYHSTLRLLKNQKTAQGIVYTCNLIKPYSDLETIKTVVKTSKHINFVLENEVEACKRVSVYNSLHFTKVLKTVLVAKQENRIAVFFEEINTCSKNGKSISGAYNLCKKQTKKTEKCISLNGLLQNPHKHPSAVLNCVRQALAAIVMYEHVGITHYDLHADNIMVRNTPYDIHVYKINKTIIPIMTFGITPVIIDFGLAHVNDSNWAATNSFLYQGISTFVKDPIIDCILLLTTVKNQMSFHNSWIVSDYISEMKAYYKYIRYVTESFARVQVDNNGWFTQRIFPDFIRDLLQSFPHIEYGIFSTKNREHVIELLQYTIIVPITTLKTSTITFKQALLRLCVLWLNTVEPVIKNIHREKLLFKDLVSYVAKHKNLVDFCDIIELKRRYPLILNFHQLVSSICVLSNAYSNKIFKISTLIKNIKKRLYAKVDQKSTLDFLNNFPFVNYMVIPGMRVLIQDIVEKKQHVFTVNKSQATKINDSLSEFNNIINDICK